MRRKNSERPLVLQPPAGFRTSRPDGVMKLSDGALMRPDSDGLYYLDNAHVHLLRSFVAQGWHAPRPDVGMRELEQERQAETLNAVEILHFAARERIALKVENGRLLMRGQPSVQLWAHLREARVALRDELARLDKIQWAEV
jgi:hypothetical protein